jgi:hypothetical protein
MAVLKHTTVGFGLGLPILILVGDPAWRGARRG